MHTLLRNVKVSVTVEVGVKAFRKETTVLAKRKGNLLGRHSRLLWLG